jgi:hypothetical protein
MTDRHVADLEKLLQEQSGFSYFAAAVGKVVKEGGDEASQQLKDFLVSELTRIGADDVALTAERLSVIKHFKLGLGLGILVAGQPSLERQRQYLQESFGVLLQKTRLSKASRLLLLTEICYMDQFLDGNLRPELNKQFGPALKEDNWSPAIRDYLEAWSKSETHREYLNELGPAKEVSPKLITVMSAKGGTGKSITAAAAVHHLLEKNKVVGLIDLDATGPTAQYIYSIKQVKESMSELPPDSATTSNAAWCFPTFLDVLRACEKRRELSFYDQPEVSALEVVAAEGAVLDCASGLQLLFVCLPESPTFCAEVARHWSDGSPEILINAVDHCIQALKSRGCEYVVLDLAPGVYGTNGRLVRWLTKYPTLPILLTSSRASDVATSIYEAPWLSSRYEFDWDGPMLHLVNRWAFDESSAKLLLKWADQALKTALEAAHTNNFGIISSATQIHAKRFWPIYYQLGLDSTPRDDDILAGNNQILTHLPEDDIIRTILNLESGKDVDSSFSLNVGQLKKSEWYMRFCSLLDNHPSQSG